MILEQSSSFCFHYIIIEYVNSSCISYSIQVLDASGKPGPGLSEFRFNFVGDYDFCRSLVANDTEAFKGNYVTWKILLGVCCFIAIDYSFVNFYLQQSIKNSIMSHQGYTLGRSLILLSLFIVIPSLNNEDNILYDIFILKRNKIFAK